MRWLPVALVVLVGGGAVAACSGGSPVASRARGAAGSSGGEESAEAGATSHAGAQSPGSAGVSPVAAGAAGEATEAGGAGGADAGGSGGYAGPVPGGAGGEAPASTAGAGGSEPTGPNPCDLPNEANVSDCNGVCGQPHGLCDGCKAFGQAEDIYLVLDGETTPQGCLCFWSGTRVPVNAGYCVRVTVQDGATANLLEAGNGCAEPTTKTCLVVSGIDEGAATDKSIHIGKPSSPAWVHYERAELVAGKCPLVCP